MKYIPLDKLIAEIDGILSACTKQTHTGVYNTCHRIKGIITSLQQEQPEVDLEKEIQSFWNANALEYRLGHVADINFLAYTARYFYELGLNARKEK